ncbi:MAG: C69 family dipeptidase [Bacteroidales bacterium]|nr:C69 family dipeptidase [Bacteroidales bacterium]
MKKPILITTLLAFACLLTPSSKACTNFLFSKGSTVDGSTMITYAADSHVRYGQLRHSPASDHEPGEMLDIYDYGSLKYLLSIPQPAHTYNVVGFINEHQLAIGETTWGGRAELEHGNKTGIDYGNLIYVTLMRAKNCREAIKVMDELTRTYGYCNGGESFSLCDPNEVWIYEIIDKGDEQGAVWVARRVPDGYVCGHANQARITQFPQEVGKFKKARGKGLHTTLSSNHLDYIDEPEVECVYSADVVSFARKQGWFSGKDADFSFADTYNPLTFSGARACDARVYAMFNRVAPDMQRYEAYAMGDLKAERLPLWVKPDHKISNLEVMSLMRDHFEGTPMDMTQDVGAGPFHCPYRWRPMDFEVDGKQYVHERATSTQQTGFSFVAQCRSWLPNKVGGILWFGVDDTYSTCYCPMFCGITEIPLCFREGNGSMSQYSETSAFWLFNRVSNFCYLRYDVMIKDVQKVQSLLEKNWSEKLARFTINNATNEQTVSIINGLCSTMANEMMTSWKELDILLLTKYIDGNIKQEENGKILTTETGVVKYPSQPKYPDWFYRAIVEDHGDILQVK